jgi:hypothetical protein
MAVCAEMHERQSVSARAIEHAHSRYAIRLDGRGRTGDSGSAARRRGGRGRRVW